MTEFETKDSGQRQELGGGFQRDVDTGKLRFDLFPPSMFKRLAGLYTRGIQKYGEENWKLAVGSKAINRFKQSAYRHFLSWLENEYDEDHGIAVCWNIFAYEWHRERIIKKYGDLEGGFLAEDTYLEFTNTSDEGRGNNTAGEVKDTGERIGDNPQES